MNSELIDPTLLQLAKKLNLDSGASPFYTHLNAREVSEQQSSQRSKKNNYEKLKDLLSSSSSSKLIYVTPDFLGLNKPDENNNNTASKKFTKETDAKLNARGSCTLENKTDYVTIDPKKTQVIKSATETIQ